MLTCVVVGSSFVIGPRKQRLDADSRDGMSIDWNIPPELFN